MSLTKISDNRFLAIVRDITERKRVEEALRLQKAVLEAQREASLDGILIVPPEGNMISFNRRFIEMWGIPLEEVLAAGTDEVALQWVRNKVVDPEGSCRVSDICINTRRKQVSMRSASKTAESSIATAPRSDPVRDWITAGSGTSEM
ncbi:MAG: hypothetical protein C4293_08180 [Nitrospiraceae bacterium]